MKFKKAFAWILAVAMVITLMPSMAFASTTNRVLTVPTVATDSSFGRDVVITMENTSGVAIDDQTIRLRLENATFERPNGDSLGDSSADIDDYIKVSKDDRTTFATLTADSLSDDSARFTFSFGGGGISNNELILITIPDEYIKSGSESGEVQLTIDQLDSSISGGTYTIATAGTGRTVAEVTGTVSTVPRGSITKSNGSNSRIEITETSINAIPAQATANGVYKEVIKLSLPKDCAWTGVELSGGMTSTPGTISGSIGVVPTFGTSTAQGLYVDQDNTRIAYLVVDVNTDSTKRDTLTIIPEYTIGKDTPSGDITVDVEGYRAYTNTDSSTRTVSDASGLVINVYGEESVTISTVAEENLPTIIAGKVQTNKDKNFTVKVTLKENMKGALQPGRYVDFDFPENIQIQTEGTSNLKYVVSKNTSANTSNLGSHVERDAGKNNDASGFSFLVPSTSNPLTGWNTNAANTITFEIPITVEAGYEGDITCTISGAKAGVDETSLVVGKAIAPISITANTTEIRTGIQSQAVADITITENIPGYLSDVRTSRDFEVGIDSLGLVSGMSIAKFDKVEVTNGNLEIGKASIQNGSIIDKVRGDYIKIPIDSSSTTASTITISGVTVNLNRTLPEGGYTLLAGGNAIVNNDDFNKDDFSDVAASLADYVKIVTPADPSTLTNKINAVFTLRQDTFTNNGETVQMDTAPYLDANNRTQLPIRYAAIACGVPESDISWNQATQTATINGQNVVLRITIGSNIMQTSAGNVVMDTAAVSSNGRIFVPIRYIANALGADVAWDATAKTITLTN